MKTVYKLLFSGMLVFVFVSLFSVSAFAEDINFTLDNYPMHDMSSQGLDKQCCNFIVKCNDGNYYYVEYFFLTKTFSGNISGFNDWKFDNIHLGVSNIVWTKDDHFVFSPCIVQTMNRSYYPLTVTYKIYIYGLGSSVPVASYDGDMYCPLVGAPRLFVYPSNNNMSYFSQLYMYGVNDFFILNVPSTYFDVNELIISDLPDVYYPYGQGTLLTQDIDLTSDYRSPSQPALGYGQCSFEDNIYINGTLVFSADGGSGQGYLINGQGSVTPEYDQNGNVVNYNFQYEADYSQFFESDGQDPEDFDSSTIDDYNSFDGDVQDSLSDFKGEFAFSDIFGDEFDLTSFRGAMIFWQDRFDEVMDFDPVFPTIVVSMLTFGIIAVILGRRLGVG